MSTCDSAYGAVNDDEIVPVPTAPSLGMTSDCYHIDRQLTARHGFR